MREDRRIDNKSANELFKVVESTFDDITSKTVTVRVNVPKEELSNEQLAELDNKSDNELNKIRMVEPGIALYEKVDSLSNEELATLKEKLKQAVNPSPETDAVETD